MRAPKWDGLLDRYGTTDEERHVLLRAGLIIERQSDGGACTGSPARERGYYDRFRDRLMFPIRDTRGRTIAFGGRVLDQGEPKYLNSPETELFHKGRELYGLYEARQATRNLQRLMVVEGYMDVVSLHQAGVTLCGGHARHVDDARAPAAHFPARRRSRVLLRRRQAPAAPRRGARSKTRWARSSRAGRCASCSCPTGTTRTRWCATKAPPAFEARLATPTPLSDYLIRELSRASKTAASTAEPGSSNWPAR